MEPMALARDGATLPTPAAAAAANLTSGVVVAAAAEAAFDQNTTPFDGIILQDELRGFNLAFYALFLPFGLLGNLYCIIVVVVIVGHQPVRKSIPDILVGTLSCVELFSLASFHAISVIAMLHGAWVFPPSVCAVQSFSVCLYVGLEFLVQAAISLDRYVALTTPFRYQRWGSASSIRLIIGAVVTFSVALAVLLKVTSQRESRLLATWYMCTSPFDLGDVVSICVMAGTALIFGSSFIIIIVCNLHLVRTLCQYNSLGVSNAVREMTDVVVAQDYQMAAAAAGGSLPGPPLPLTPIVNGSSNGVVGIGGGSNDHRKDSTLVITPRKSGSSSLVPNLFFPTHHRASVASHIIVVGGGGEHISSDGEGVTYNFTSDSIEKEGSDADDGGGGNQGTAGMCRGVPADANDPPALDEAYAGGLPPPPPGPAGPECSIMITIEEASGEDASPTLSRGASIPKIELIDEENNVHKPCLLDTNHIIVGPPPPVFSNLPEITIESEPDTEADALPEKSIDDVCLTPNRKSGCIGGGSGAETSLLTPETALLSPHPQGSPLRSPLRTPNSLDPSMARRTSARSMVSVYKYPGGHRPSHLSISGQELEANPLLYMSYIQRQVSKVMKLMEKAANRQKREVVLARVVFINACVFVLTWLPFIATTILSWFEVPVPAVVSDLSLKLIFSHALINPVFHGLCRHNYRKGFMFITRKTLHCITLGYVKTPGEDLVFYESRRRKVKRHLQAAAVIKTDRARRRRQSALCVQALSHHLSTHRLSVQPPSIGPVIAAMPATPTPSRSRTSSRSPSATPMDLTPSPQLQSMFEQYLEQTESDSDLSSIDYDALDVNDHETLLRHLASASYVDLYDADLFNEEELEIDVDMDQLIGPPAHSV